MDKIVFLEWKSFGNEHIVREFKEQGYEIVSFPFPRETEDVRNGMELTEKLTNFVLKEKPSFVFSFNFFPVAAIACRACRTRYVSWVYDSPYILMYSETVKYDTNRLFVFDKAETLKFQEMGIRNVFYLPMPAATAYYDTIIPSDADYERYHSDVTFIGSMYSEKGQHMFRHLDNLDEYTRGYLFGLMQAQKDLYGIDILESSLTKDIVSRIQKICPVTEHGDGFETVEWVLANYFLARKVTAMEREEIIDSLSEKYSVKLFTPEATPHLSKVKNMGRVDYYTQAPYAMKCAKINLNISLRSIHSGMPLRALDILGCGGFLLTNYQADFMDYFEPGKDFVYYSNTKEVVEIVGYYLSHEQERMQIAKNGYEKVCQYLSYKKQINSLLDSI